MKLLTADSRLRGDRDNVRRGQAGYAPVWGYQAGGSR